MSDRLMMDDDGVKGVKVQTELQYEVQHIAVCYCEVRTGHVCLFMSKIDTLLVVKMVEPV